MPLSVKGLTLVGTVHSDPKGFSKTRALLEKLAPDLVFVEISPFSLGYRKREGAALRKTLFRNVATAAAELKMGLSSALSHSRVRGIIRQLSLPFEYRAAVSYGKAKGVETVPVDSSDFSREWIETWPEMISVENLRGLLRLESETGQVPREYREAELAMSGRIRDLTLLLSGRADLESWGRREEEIASRIVSETDRAGSSKPVYIGGWKHLLPGGQFRPLRSILGVQCSSCVLLGVGPVCSSSA